MNKIKSLFVTVLVAVMLAAIIYGLYRLEISAYRWIILILGGYGFLNAFAGFYRWLGRTPALAPVHLDDFHIDEETYDQIVEEMRAGHEDL